jgi:hypothetical protein
MHVVLRKMAIRRPSRHMTYHDLRDALGDTGCALCRLVGSAVDRYLRAILYESVNDPGLREKLRASRGFCREHAWQVQRRGSPLSISILWQDLLSLEPQPGDSRRGASNHGRRACPACVVATEAEERYLGTLLEHLEADGLHDSYAASDGLCLPHLHTALAQSPAGVKDFLLAVESRKLGELSEELSEIIRKNDYRFREEPWGSEKDAWVRATRKLAGEPPER